MRNLLQKIFSFSKRTNSRPGKKKNKSKGQSLVELTLTLPLILMLFSGMVEFGFMLNYYLSLLDATRYAAREYSGGDPWIRDANNNYNGDNISGYTLNGQSYPGFYSPAASTVYAELAPKDINDTTRKITLNPATDDVIISVYSIDQNGNITDYPTAGPYHLYGNQHSPAVTDATIQSGLVSGGPCEGILSVEVDYTYHQVLNLPWMAWLGSPVLPAYTIMPNQAVEPQC